MEFQNQPEDSGLFSLNLDAVGKNHLAEAAKWARFLAIVGFIGLGIFELCVIFGGSFFASAMTRNYNGFDNSELSSTTKATMTVAIIVYYLIAGVFFFFGLLFLYRFALNMRLAIKTNSQEAMTRAFQNLKILFRYKGILTIIGLSFVVIALIFVVGAALLVNR
jgi:hypothetical protein